MPSLASHSTLPLDTLVFQLEREGFAVSPDTYLRLQEALRVFAPSYQDQPQQLRRVLAPLVAQNPAQQQQFYQIFDEYYAQIQAQVKRELDPDPDQEDKDKKLEPQPPKPWLYYALGTVGLLLLIFLFLYLYRPQPVLLPENISFVADTTYARTGDTLRFTIPDYEKQREALDFYWDFKDGSEPGAVQDSITPHAFGREGDYAVELTWQSKTTDTLAGKTKLRILIEDACRPRTRAQVLSLNPLPLGDSLEVQNLTPGRDTLTFVWDFGDGQRLTGRDSLVTHRYDTAGVYNLKLTAYTPDSCKRTFAQIVEVIAQPEIKLPAQELIRDEEPPLIASFSYQGIFLLMGVFLGLWLALEAYWYYAKRGFGQSQIEPKEKPPYILDLPAAEEHIRPQEALYEVANTLRQRQEGEVQTLDIHATLEATIRAGGFPRLHFQTNTRPTEYLILIDQQGANHQQARFFDYLINTLAQEEVYLEKFYYLGDPRNVWNPAHPEGLYLHQLAQKYGQHRLLIFGDGHDWIDAETGQIYPWARRQMGTWARKALLTPLPPEDWGYEEQLIYQLLPLLPADLSGQAQLLDQRSAEEAPSWPAYKQQFKRKAETSRFQVDFEDKQALRGFLDTHPRLFAWLCALAVYPRPDWAITLAIGRGWEEQIPEAKGLLSAQNLVQLTRVPWLNTSEEIPAELRQALLAELSPAEEKAAREAVLRVLQDPRTEVPTDSIAHEEKQTQILAQTAQLHPRDSRAWLQLRRLGQSGLLQDELLRKELEKRYQTQASQVFLRSFSLLALLGISLWVLHLFNVVEDLTSSPGYGASLQAWNLVQTQVSDSAVYYNNLGVAQYRDKQYTGVENNFQRALQLEPDYATPRYNLDCIGFNQASARYNLGQYQLAARGFQPFLSHDSLELEAKVNLGLCYVSLNQMDSARKYYEEVQATGKGYLDQYPGNYLAYYLEKSKEPKPDLLAQESDSSSLPTLQSIPEDSEQEAPTTPKPPPDLPEMVFVPGGSFQMGSDDGEDDEKPVHTVQLDDFYIGKYEVTQKQWREVMGENPSKFQGCDDCPVENVSWNDVQEFIQKLNAQTGQNYRLPTEAEWEYAARGGQKTQGYQYAGSNNIDEVAWYRENSDSKTHPVGQKRPNELGLYDMSGNVYEWCSDWYGSDYYASSPEFNPPGPASGSYRVHRGGSWYDYSVYCRVAYRRTHPPEDRYNYLGLRLSRTL